MELVIALATLTFLEIVLGVDNIIFISIVTNKLPEKQQPKARSLGLILALVFRIVLLVSITWLITHLTNPLFSVAGLDFSVREIILALGGLFLLAKSTSEIHHKMESEGEKPKETNKKVGFLGVIVQISLLDIVFSFDSILTAVGLTTNLSVMITAVAIAIGVMIVFAGKISHFINANPTLEILALSFLILIGFMLILEGVHIEVPKGYIYFAVFFSLAVEIVNMKIRKKRRPLKLNKRWRWAHPDQTEWDTSKRSPKGE